MSGILPDPHESMVYTLKHINQCISNRDYRSAYRYIYYLLAVVFWTCKMEDKNDPDPPMIKLPPMT